MAHLIKVDLKAQLFSYTIDEDKKRYLELLDGKLLLVTNTATPPAEVVQRPDRWFCRVNWMSTSLDRRTCRHPYAGRICPANA